MAHRVSVRHVLNIGLTDLHSRQSLFKTIERLLETLNRAEYFDGLIAYFVGFEKHPHRDPSLSVFFPNVTVATYFAADSSVDAARLMASVRVVSCAPPRDPSFASMASFTPGITTAA